MQWLEVSVQTDGEAAEAVAEVFNRLGEGGAVVETVIHSDDTPYASDPAVSVKTYLAINGGSAQRRRQIEEALWHLSQVYPIPAPQFRKLAEEDWSEAWKKGYHIQHIAPRLTVVPSWEPYLPRNGEVILRLDPGMAFGTGLHPTTRLCLLELESRIRSGDRVLDVGTGSGILAIAAAKFGAAHVIGVDVDPVAARVAQENVGLNNVDDRVRVEEGTLDTLDLAPGSLDLIVVNILADVVVELAPALAGLLRPAGAVVASGIIEEYRNVVIKALQSAGMRLVGRRQDRDWVALVAAPQ